MVDVVAEPRSGSFSSLSRRFLNVLAGAIVVLLAGCVDEDVDAPTNYPVCGTDGQIHQGEGDWDPTMLVWDDAPDGRCDVSDTPCAADADCPTGETCTFKEARPHADATAVHAIHLNTKRIMVFHGHRDQRVWRMGANAPDEWYPMLLEDTWNEPPENGFEGCDPPGEPCYPNSVTGVPDLFCATHVQLRDGSILLAGGDVDGSADGGGRSPSFASTPGRRTCSMVTPMVATVPCTAGSGCRACSSTAGTQLWCYSGTGAFS